MANISLEWRRRVGSIISRAIRRVELTNSPREFGKQVASLTDMSDEMEKSVSVFKIS